MVYIIGFLSMFFATNPDLLRSQAFIGLVGMSAIITVMAEKRLKSIPVALALYYFLWRAITMFALRGQKPDWVLALATQNYVWVLTISVVMIFAERKIIELFINLAAAVCFGTAALLLLRRIHHVQFWCFAWQNNASADASMVAAMFPILAFRKVFERSATALSFSTVAVLVPIAAIIVSGSSTAIATLALAHVLYGVFHFRKPLYAIAIIALASLASAAGFLYLHKPFMESHGRFVTWRLMMEFWRRAVNPLYGSGSGLFFAIGPKVQQVNGWANDQMFAWMHNDWLQVLFEQGVIGLLLLLILSVWCLYKARTRPWLFTALATYGFIMCTQFPFRFFAAATIGALLVRETCETQTRTTL